MRHTVNKIIAIAAILVAAFLTASVPLAWAAAKPEPFLPPAPRSVVVWHCGPDVTSGRVVLVKHGRTYDVVAKGAQFAGGRVVASCAPVTAPVRVTPTR